MDNTEDYFSNQMHSTQDILITNLDNKINANEKRITHIIRTQSKIAHTIPYDKDTWKDLQQLKRKIESIIRVLQKQRTDAILRLSSTKYIHYE